MKTSYILTLQVLLFLVGGCYNCNEKDVGSFKKPHEVNVTVEEYRLQPADEITISATRIPELHAQAPL